MKKKPPPGATLIARLKEQRLAREAELARRQQQAAEDASAAVKSKPAAKDDDRQTAQPAAAKEPATAAAKPAASEYVKSSQDKADKHAARSEDQAIVVEVAESQHHVVVAPRQSRDLIHRDIDFDDLRPTSSDYFVLTDEIRLAGRFAAVGLIAQGLRLHRIRDAEIHKNHYLTFEDYCRKEHQMSATYAYRLMRMAEMAEQVARLGHPVSTKSDSMPDPFEVMIGLGHRHLLALLPLELQAAQELLVNGVPVSDSERVPIARATEKQIRNALKSFAPGAAKTVLRLTDKKALVSEKQLIPALSKLVEMLEDWALWLDGEAPAELQAARMGRGPLLNRLAKRFRAASGKIADSLEVGEDQ